MNNDLINIVNNEKYSYTTGKLILESLRKFGLYTECLRYDEREEKEQDINIEKLLKNEYIFDISARQEHIDINDNIIKIVKLIFKRMKQNYKKDGEKYVRFIEERYFTFPSLSDTDFAKRYNKARSTVWKLNKKAVICFYNEIISIYNERDIKLLSIEDTRTDESAIQPFLND